MFVKYNIVVKKNIIFKNVVVFCIDVFFLELYIDIFDRVSFGKIIYYGS